MTNNELLKKQILYRSSHRGTKEMDLLLSNFVKKHLNTFDDTELNDLNEFLFIDDETIYNWYFKKIESKKIPSNNISKIFRKFVLNKNI